MFERLDDYVRWRRQDRRMLKVTRSSRTYGVVALLICCFLYFSFVTVSFLLSAAPSFDGAMNFQVSRNLARSLEYATDYPVFTRFALRIKTGIPLLLPAALSLKIFGHSSVASQIPNAAFLVGVFCLGVWFAIRFCSSVWGGIAVCCAMFLTPQLFQYGLRGYGEIPSLFFFLAAVWLLWRNYGNSAKNSLFIGVFLGLAYLTKTVMLVGAGALILALGISALLGHRERASQIIWIVVGFSIPVALFEIYRVFSLGADVYSLWWKRESELILHHAGVDGVTDNTLGVGEKFFAHLQVLVGFLRSGPILTVVYIIAPSVVLLWQTVYVDRLKSQKSLAVATLAIAVTTYFVWWLAISPTAMALLSWAPRRIINGVLVNNLLCILAVFQLWQFAGWKKHLTFLIGPVLVWIPLTLLVSGDSLVPALESARNNKRDAQEVASYIDKNIDSSESICGFGWWQSPLISFLSDRKFCDLWKANIPYGILEVPMYLSIDDWAQSLGNEQIQGVRKAFRLKKVYEAGAYSIHRIEERFSPSDLGARAGGDRLRLSPSQ